MQMDLSDANKKLNDVQWLPAQFEDTFAQLIAEIERMRDPGEDLDIPKSYQSFAWRTAWNLWGPLTIRSEHRQRAEAERKAAELKYDGPSWEDYIGDLGTLRTFVRLQSISQLEQNWAGLEFADLSEPVMDNKPVMGWPDRAFRIRRAINKFTDLGPARRRDIPFELRLDALEHENAQFNARLKEVESLFRLNGCPDTEKSAAIN